MKTTGDLLKDKIIVKKAKDVGRLYNKSFFGKTISGNFLQLELIEGVFLLDEDKINIYKKGELVNFKNLFLEAAKKDERFLTKYLVFKDLRKRGVTPRIYKEKEFDFYLSSKNQAEKNCVISVFSERENIDIDSILDLIKETDKDCELLIAVVDEEGDITYYKSGFHDMKGKIEIHNFSDIKGWFTEGRILIFNKEDSKKLFNKEFFGKTLDEKGLQLSMIESVYLMDKGSLEIKDISDKNNISVRDLKEYSKKTQIDFNILYKVFKDLKQRGFIIKTGFKFGVHFRAYSDLPDKTHAEYLIHILKHEKELIWTEISRAVRLAHSVNKLLVFAVTYNKKDFEYISFYRCRP